MAKKVQAGQKSNNTMDKQYKTLKEFYPYYLTEHLNPVSRILHFIGTGGFIAIFLFAIINQQWWILLFGPLCGYGFAWLGHFVFEKNKPATFIYPAFSLASDFIMFYHIITFQINKKIEKAKETILKN
jgi:hypothetical protein